MSDSDSPLKFEQQLLQLQDIVSQLESGQLGLDEALQKYQQGVELLSSCHKVLKVAERKIELLSGVDADGNPIKQPMNDESSSLDEKVENRAQRRGKKTAAVKKSKTEVVDDERKLF